MLLNYLKLAIRLLARTPFISMINIGGLSVGFTVFFILWLYAQNELKTDQFHENWDNTYRFGVITQWTDDTINWEQAIAGKNRLPLTIQVSHQYPEIEMMTTITSPLYFGRAGATSSVGHGSEVLIRYDKAGGERISFLESKAVYADSNAFSFFSIPLLKGDPEKILLNKNAVALSEKASEKYFGSEDPMGKTLLLIDSIPLTVTGIFKGLPGNTHLDFDIVLSVERIRKVTEEKAIFGDCYFKIREGVDCEALQERINSDLGEEIKKAVWGNWPYGKAEAFLQPIADIAFDHLRGDLHTVKSKRILTTLGIFSWVILFIAWMNYINLTISLNTNRAKELVARKSSGARAVDFIFQFLIEAILIHIIAVLIAFTFIQLLKVPMQHYLNFYTLDWENIPEYSILVMTLLFSGSILLTSLYPSIITIKHSPKSLFGVLKFGKGENQITNVLTTFQFSLAITFIILVSAAFLQNKYILQRNIGLNVDQVLIIDLPAKRSADFIDKQISFQNEASKLHRIKGNTSAFTVAGNHFANSIYLERKIPGLRVETDGGVDENFIPFFDIKIIEGRNFSASSAANENAVIISKRTSERLGFRDPAEAVGARLNTRWGSGLEIIGVIEDYKMRPFLSRTEEDDGYNGWPGLALSFRDLVASEDVTHKVCFRVDSENLLETIGGIENEYKKIFPGYMFKYAFAEDKIMDQYKQYTTALRQLFIFAMLAIGVACVGLIGMMTNKVIQKTKEIGIRKVMGAAMHQIGFLLMNSTVKQVIVATIISIPIAFYISQKYLEEFSQRVSLELWHYLAPVVILVVIMFASIASVLWKAAHTNPVDSLRYE